MLRSSDIAPGSSATAAAAKVKTIAEFAADLGGDSSVSAAKSVGIVEQVAAVADIFAR